MFCPGSFGSTLEYCVRRFSNEFQEVVATVDERGSMHGYKKELHPASIEQAVSVDPDLCQIATPVYPGINRLTPAETVIKLRNGLYKDHSTVLVHLPDLAQIQRNSLIFFYKWPQCIDTILQDKAQCWNPQYQSYKDMQPWELREALSFYIDGQLDHLTVKDHAHPNWLLITPNDILYDFKNTVVNILKYFNLTPCLQGIDDFYQDWFSKQTPLLNEYLLIEKIVESVTEQNDFCWSPISLIGEAILQSQLRRCNLELACDGLDVMPTNSSELASLLIKASKQL